MIKFTKGNIFDSDAEALVNAVNTVGVMEKGIALEFKKRFPQNFEIYKGVCDAKMLSVGDILIVKDDKTIINFPTKIHWRDKSKYEYIQSGLRKLREELKDLNITSVAIPALGCGLGGLDWKIVKKMIVDELNDCDTCFYVYEPI